MCGKLNLEQEEINHLQQGSWFLTGNVVMVTKYTKYNGSTLLTGLSELWLLY